MQRLIEKHSVGLIFSIMLVVIVGYLDMRSMFVSMNGLIGNMNTNLVKAVAIAELTRAEQLLRTDEIEWVQDMRKTYPGNWGKTKKGAYSD